jgi:very-short-patch-repair endonuclease
MTAAQMLLRTHLIELGYKDVESEYQFCLDRKWRADLAIPSLRILLECDGGQFRGGHRRGLALERDYEKQNRAQMEGWRILRWTNRQILTGEAFNWLKEHLQCAN